MKRYTVFKLFFLVRIAWGFNLYLLLPVQCLADDYFDVYSVYTGGKNNKEIDLSFFKKRHGQLPGWYQINIILNGQNLGESKLETLIRHGELTPCIKKIDLIKWGVTGNDDPIWRNMPEQKKICDIGKHIPNASLNYQFNKQTLFLSIPQRYMGNQPRNSISIDKWDDGINALILNYSYSGSHKSGSYYRAQQNDNYLNLRNGLNIYGWRIRNYSIYAKNRQGRNHWQSFDTYASHDIRAIKSQFTVGDTYIDSSLFDSFSYRGIQLASDDEMQPERLRGFAPIIRGIAQSHAQVTVKQNGNIIWQSYVPAGAFEIRDLYPTSSSGDLQINIREADGSVRQFYQAFSAVPMMVREGRIKYNFNVGKYAANHTSSTQPFFIHSELIVGLPWLLTAYGGSILSKDYHAVSLGTGKVLGYIGAMSLDVTFAETRRQQQRYRGNSFRFNYSKNILSSGTNISLSGYRYSTSGYYDFAEANSKYPVYKPNSSHFTENDTDYSFWDISSQKKNKAVFNLNQRILSDSSIYISSYLQNYWDLAGKEFSLSIGNSHNFKSFSYTLNYSYTKNPIYHNSDQIYSLSVQIPLSTLLPSSWINLSSNLSNNHSLLSSIGINGTALENNNLSYNLQQNISNENQINKDNTSNLSLNYKGKYAEYQAAYHYSEGKSDINYGMSGGILIHRYGYTFSQSLGNSIALIHATDASDVRVLNQTGIFTDKDGLAVIPYLAPYRTTTLSLDTAQLPQNIDLLKDTVTVTPTAGAVVLANYPTLRGKKILFKITNPAIPLGAQATIRNHTLIREGIVNDRGRVYLSGVPSSGTLHLTWHDGACSTHYHTRESENLSLITVDCK